MTIRFQADADLNPAIGRGLVRQQPRIDWRPARGVIADATHDADVLALAADAGRVLVSCDVHTMPRHFATFVASRSSPGAILIPPETGVTEAIDRLLVAWLSWTAEELENQMWWLPA